MKILHVEKKMKLSGQALRVSRVIRGLTARGHEVGLACPPGSALGDEAEGDGLSVCRMRMDGMRLYLSARTLRRHIRHAGYQIVHPHGARDHLLSALALVGQRGVALVRTKHNMEPLHGGAFGRLLYNRRTTRIVAISQAVREVLMTSGVPGTQIDLAFTGIDTARFSPRPRDPGMAGRLGLPDGAFVVGLTARLASESVDAPTLLRAFGQIAPRYPHARLLLIGRGEDAMAKVAEELGIADRVVFAGFVRDVPAVLSVVDLYVQPNRKAALGTAALEAMAMAKPVVATRVGGHQEAVLEEQTGLLCPAADPDAMAEAMASLMERPPEALAEMGRKGRERAVELFDQERMIDQIEAAYRRVAGPSSDATRR
ncbi:MAG: glycosyltransferase [Planctomycetota bacterium]